MNSAVGRVVSSLNEPAKPFSTWQITLVVSVLAILVTYYSAADTFTLSYFQRLLGARLNEDQILEQYRLALKYREATIALAPVGILLRALFSASVIQALVLVIGERIRFDATFRAVLLCSPIMLIQGLAEQYAVLSSTTITGTTSFTPLSIARSGCCYSGESQLVNDLLARLNVFEGSWVLAVAFLLLLRGRVPARSAFLVVGAYWAASTIAAACISQLFRA